MAEAVRYSGAPLEADRAKLVSRGKLIEYLTIGWNGFEAAVALLSGVVAGSIALVGFGLDSLIETASAVVLLWRLRADRDIERRENRERIARRLVGVSFLLLSSYVGVEVARALWLREPSSRSWPGILIAAAAVIVMPLLARAKRRVAARLNSRALHSDSKQADFCAYLSAILLVGLLLQWLFGWWWADPVAALVMVPIIAREGVLGVRGRECEDCD